MPSTFAVATGGPAGLYYPFGGGMASLWSKHLEGVNAKAEVTGGSVTNVIQVARQESELGIAMADVVTDAYLGQGRFPEPLHGPCKCGSIPCSRHRHRPARLLHEPFPFPEDGRGS